MNQPKQAIVQFYPNAVECKRIEKEIGLHVQKEAGKEDVYVGNDCNKCSVHGICREEADKVDNLIFKLLPGILEKQKNEELLTIMETAFLRACAPFREQIRCVWIDTD